MSKRGIQSASREILKNPLTAAPLWHVIDAKGHVVGRVAQMVSKILLGKHKPIYDPAANTGDYVVVVNARHAQFTGKKFEQKYYKWHTGFVGGLKKMSVKRMLEKNPTKVLHHAIMGMIPKNRLKSVREKKLKLYADEQHPHVTQIMTSSLSPLQRNIPVNYRYKQHMTIDEEDEHVIGGTRVKLHMGKDGKLVTEEEKIPSLLQRAKVNRSLTRLAEVGEVKQFYKPKHEKEVVDTVPHDFAIGTEPARLPWASEPHFVLIDKGTELWNWPKPDEKFEDNPEQLGRIMSQEELNELAAREEKFKKEDMWRLIMRLTRVQMVRAQRLDRKVEDKYIEACRQIPTQFLIDEKDLDRRMREAFGLLDTKSKGSNDAEFGDFSFGFTERTKEEMSKPPTFAAVAPAKGGPAAKAPAKK